MIILKFDDHYEYSCTVMMTDPFWAYCQRKDCETCGLYKLSKPHKQNQTERTSLPLGIGLILDELD